MSQDYVLPKTIDAALALLKEHGGKAKIIAGGTDLVLQESRKKIKTAVLVDISHIQDLCGIKEEDGWIVLGANVTHNEATLSPLTQRKAQALAIACGKVGGKQIRNIATVAGNILTAHPLADAALALSALEARCVLHSCDGVRRELSMEEMYTGEGASAVNSHAEILTHIRIPALGAGEGSSYQRMELRKDLVLSILSVAAKVVMHGNCIKSAHLAITRMGPGSRRAVEAETFLAGKTPSAAVFAEAGALANKNALFRTTIVGGTKEFRHEILPVFITRALEEAVNRAIHQAN